MNDNQSIWPRYKTLAGRNAYARANNISDSFRPFVNGETLKSAELHYVNNFGVRLGVTLTVRVKDVAHTDRYRLTLSFTNGIEVVADVERSPEMMYEEYLFRYFLHQIMDRAREVLRNYGECERELSRGIAEDLVKTLQSTFIFEDVGLPQKPVKLRKFDWAGDGHHSTLIEGPYTAVVAYVSGDKVFLLQIGVPTRDGIRHVVRDLPSYDEAIDTAEEVISTYLERDQRKEETAKQIKGMAECIGEMIAKLKSCRL